MGFILPLFSSIAATLGVVSRFCPFCPNAEVHLADFNKDLLNSTKFISNICIYIDFPYQNVTKVPSEILKLCDKNSTLCCAYDVTDKKSESKSLPLVVASVNHTLVSTKFEPIEPLCKQKLTTCKPYCCKGNDGLFV